MGTGRSVSPAPTAAGLPAADRAPPPPRARRQAGSGRSTRIREGTPLSGRPGSPSASGRSSRRARAASRRRNGWPAARRRTGRQARARLSRLLYSPSEGGVRGSAPQGQALLPTQALDALALLQRELGRAQGLAGWGIVDAAPHRSRLPRARRDLLP